MSYAESFIQHAPSQLFPVIALLSFMSLLRYFQI